MSLQKSSSREGATNPSSDNPEQGEEALEGSSSSTTRALRETQNLPNGRDTTSNNSTPRVNKSSDLYEVPSETTTACSLSPRSDANSVLTQTQNDDIFPLHSSAGSSSTLNGSTSSKASTSASARVHAPTSTSTGRSRQAARSPSPVSVSTSSTSKKPRRVEPEKQEYVSFKPKPRGGVCLLYASFFFFFFLVKEFWLVVFSSLSLTCEVDKASQSASRPKTSRVNTNSERGAIPSLYPTGQSRARTFVVQARERV